MARPEIVALVNRKGGCGKTSGCFHLSGGFAVAGKRTLLVDMDPQASLTQGFLGPQATEDLAKSQTIASLFDNRYDPEPSDLIVPTGFDRIDLVPGANVLDDHNVPRPQEAGNLQFTLRTFLNEIADAYDIILLDCPPNLHLCSWTALTAATHVLIPFQAEDFGSQGITHIQRAFDQALGRTNPRLRLLGYLVTMFDKRLAVQTAYERLLREMYGDQVFAETMPMASAFKEAVSARSPVTHYKPKSPASVSVRRIVAEMQTRFEILRSRPPTFLTRPPILAAAEAGS